MQKTFAFFIVLWSVQIFAFPGAPCINKQLKDKLNPLIQPVGIFGDPDRRTEEQFAQENGMTVPEVQKRYAATGKLICAQSQLTANLVLVNNLIVTSAHAFFNFDTCAKNNDPKSCKFVVQIGNKTIESKVDNLEAIGYRCPGKLSRADDWAVLRLSNGIEGVDPYSVNANASIDDDQKVTSVNGINRDFYVGNRRMGDHVKSIGKCAAHKVYRDNGDPIYFSSDCDGSSGSSGAAILKDSGKTPVLLGVTSNSKETAEQQSSALRRGRSNSGDFDETRWAAYHIPVRGDFLGAVLRAAQK